MAAHPPVILASQSPRRHLLLRDVLPEFEVMDSHATELDDRTVPPRRLCELNAERKAWSVAQLRPDHLVMGADTLVFLDGEPFGKPSDLDEARRMLRQLSGRIHEVITGVALVHRAGARVRVFSEVTRVKFRSLSDDDVEAYIGLVAVLDKAGAYALQEQGHLIIETVEGSSSNVVGLPVERLREALERWPG